METMRITSKGQVPIPADIRDRLGLLPQTEVVFEIEDDTLRIRRADNGKPGRGKQLSRHMRGRATTSMTATPAAPPRKAAAEPAKPS